MPEYTSQTKRETERERTYVIHIYIYIYIYYIGSIVLKDIMVINADFGKTRADSNM